MNGHDEETYEMNEPKEKTAEERGKLDKCLEPIKTLAYRCLQWEDGEIKGFDSQMMDSLLPLIVRPLLDEYAAQETAQLRIEGNKTTEELRKLINFLNSETAQLREALKQHKDALFYLLPLAEYAVESTNYESISHQYKDKFIIEAARKLTNQPNDSTQ